MDTDFVSAAMDPDYVWFTTIEIFLAQEQGHEADRIETMVQLEGVRREPF